MNLNVYHFQQCNKIAKIIPSIYLYMRSAIPHWVAQTRHQTITHIIHTLSPTGPRWKRIVLWSTIPHPRNPGTAQLTTHIHRKTWQHTVHCCFIMRSFPILHIFQSWDQSRSRSYGMPQTLTVSIHQWAPLSATTPTFPGVDETTSFSCTHQCHSPFTYIIHICSWLLHIHSSLIQCSIHTTNPLKVWLSS